MRERERSVCKREDQTLRLTTRLHLEGREVSSWISEVQGTGTESVRGGALLIFLLFPGGTIPQIPPCALEAVQTQAALSFINNWPRGTWFFSADTNQGSPRGAPLHSLPVVRSIPVGALMKYHISF